MELTAGEAWSRILESVRAKLPEQGYQTWLAPTSAVGLTNKVLVVGAPNAFAVEWIEDKYGPMLLSAATSLFGDGFRLAFEPTTPGPASSGFPSVSASQLTEIEPAPKVGASRCAATEPEPARLIVGALNPRYTLARFVVARNNELAAAAARAIVSSPGKEYNPLFIHGGVGLGKTHLMQAVGHAILEGNTSARVAYVSCEQFMNELIEAIRERRTSQFHSRYRGIDVLLVDDVHFLAAKEATQEEFFHTFNALYDAQKQIILTSDRPPSAITTLQERLVSRFEWGLVCDIKPPDFETRLAILRMKAGQDGLCIDDSVLSLIASRCSSSVRALEGAVIKLLAFSSLTHRELDRHLAEEVLASSPRIAERPDPEEIKAAVAQEFAVTVKALESKSRTRELVLARQLSMYMMKDILELSHTQIGRLHGGRDHSTVIHSLRRVTELLRNDEELRVHLGNLDSRFTRRGQ